MKKLTLVLILTLTLLFAFSAVPAVAAVDLDTLQTPAEASNWERTTSSQEVIDFCVQVAALSEGRIRVEYLGTTSGGRQIPMMVVGQPAPKDAAAVSADKAIALVNCNIHSGEVEGKEAMLIFAREIAQGQHDDLLEDLVILIVPNMSPDGNDALGKHRIRSQFTPKLVGTRPDGDGYNINRDMTKLDSSGANAIVKVMNDWDPVIFIDAHATNGSFMRHAITYNWGLHPNTDSELMAYNRDEFCQLALGSESPLGQNGKVAIPYGNFGVYYSGIVADGWQTFEDYPRYTTNYAGLRNRLALLLEVYSYDPFDVRVETQYDCILGALKAVQTDKVKIKQLIADADARSIARATKGIDPKTDLVALDSKLAVLTELNGGKVDVLSYATGEDGTVAATRLTDDEGDPCGVEFTGEATYTIDYWGKFVPTGTEVMGAYYLVEADAPAAIELLMRHGVEVYQLNADVTLTASQFKWYEVDKLNKSASLYEGHYMNAITGAWQNPSAAQVFPAGTYVISTAQPLGSFAALMLEPASRDGATSWNYLDASLLATAGTVRATYPSNPADTEADIAIPIFKVGAYTSIAAAEMTMVATAPAVGGTPEAGKVVVSNQKIMVNGVETAFDVYNIDDNNYFKLRDVAFVLKDTASKFSVEYDNDTRAIAAVTGSDYQVVGGEMTIGANKASTCVVSNQKAYFNGLITNAYIYNIGGNNYFKLRDLNQVFNFVVDYDNDTRTVIINSSDYVAPAA